MDQKPVRESRRHHRLMWMWCGVVVGGVVAASVVTQGTNIRGVHAQGPLPSSSVQPQAYVGPGSSFKSYFQALPSQVEYAPKFDNTTATATVTPGLNSPATPTKTPPPTSTVVKSTTPSPTPQGYGKPKN